MSKAAAAELDLVAEGIVAFFRAEIVNDPTLELGLDDEIIARGLIDSMGIVRLLTHLQERYGIAEFDRHDVILDNFRTIGTIAALVMRYRSPPAAARAG